jgi:hypothetical protein
MKQKTTAQDRRHAQRRTSFFERGDGCVGNNISDSPPEMNGDRHHSLRGDVLENARNMTTEWTRTVNVIVKGGCATQRWSVAFFVFLGATSERIYTHRGELHA